MYTYFLFLLGFVLLIKGADLLVDGASAIAGKFYISDLVIVSSLLLFMFTGKNNSEARVENIRYIMRLCGKENIFFRK